MSPYCLAPEFQPAPDEKPFRYPASNQPYSHIDLPIKCFLSTILSCQISPLPSQVSTRVF